MFPYVPICSVALQIKIVRRNHFWIWIEQRTTAQQIMAYSVAYFHSYDWIYFKNNVLNITSAFLGGKGVQEPKLTAQSPLIWRLGVHWHGSFNPNKGHTHKKSPIIGGQRWGGGLSWPHLNDPKSFCWMMAWVFKVFSWFAFALDLKILLITVIVFNNSFSFESFSAGLVGQPHQKSAHTGF